MTVTLVGRTQRETAVDLGRGQRDRTAAESLAVEFVRDVSYLGNPEMLTVTLSPAFGTLTPSPNETLPPGLTESELLATVRVGATGIVVPDPLVLPEKIRWCCQSSWCCRTRLRARPPPSRWSDCDSRRPDPGLSSSDRGLPPSKSAGHSRADHCSSRPAGHR